MDHDTRDTSMPDPADGPGATPADIRTEPPANQETDGTVEVGVEKLQKVSGN